MDHSTKVATAGATGGPQRMAGEPSPMLDVRAVAAMLGCSQRHVYRLADAGRMPRPLKLGALCRWPRKTILEWIDSGCPRCREGAER